MTGGASFASQFKLPLRMIARPGFVIKREYLDRALSWQFVLGLYLVFWLADILAVHHVGNRMPGGNPMLWAFDGALYEFDGLMSLFGYRPEQFWLSGMFWFSLAWKAVVDIALIVGPAFYAVKICGKPATFVSTWARTYLCLLAGCDVFLHLGMLPWFAYEAEWLAISEQRAAVATHLLEIWVAALNAILFGFAYQRVFQLSFQQTYMGWFVLNIVPGVLLGTLLLVFVS